MCVCMKCRKKYIFISLFVAILGIFLIVLMFIKSTKYPDAKYDKESINSIIITIEHSVSKLEFSTKSFNVSSVNGIETVLKSIELIRQSNDNRLDGVEAPSAFYCFEYKFKNGKTSRIKHEVPPNNLGDPLTNIWSLDEVIKQINPFFTVNISDIKVVELYKNSNSETITKKIVVDASLDKLIYYCQQITIKSNGLLNFVDTPFGINFYSDDGEIICSMPLNETTPYLDDICSNSMEIKNTFKDWGIQIQ